MSGDEAEDMDEDLARAIELSMQEGDEGEVSMGGAEAASGGGGGDSTDEPAPKKQAPDEVQRAIDTVATASRGAGADPARLVPLAKDLGVLLKLLHNPVESPDEPKFRKVKLANKRIAAVLGNPGAREVLLAAGFVPDAEGAFLVLPPGDASGPLTRAVEGVTEAQRGLQELHWLHSLRAALPSLNSQPWAPEGAAKQFVQLCLNTLHAPATSLEDKVVWVGRLHHVLSEPAMRECRAVVEENGRFAAQTVREVVLAQIRNGGHDVSGLVLANKCFALLQPPGDKRTLESRLDFCYACLEAALPEDDEQMELKARPSPHALGSCSRSGVCLTNGLRFAFARRCGLSRTTFWSRRSGSSAPSLRWPCSRACSAKS